MSDSEGSSEDSGASFLDDRADEDLSEHSSDFGSDPESDPELDPDSNISTKRKRVVLDDYTPARVPEDRGPWGCVLVIGHKAPQEVDVLLLPTFPGDDVSGIIEHAMITGFASDVRRALEVLGLRHGNARPIVNVQRATLPPYGPTRMFYVNCIGKYEDAEDDEGEK